MMVKVGGKCTFDLKCDTFLAALLLFSPTARVLLKEENFQYMRRLAQLILLLFGSTYISEHKLSEIKFNKSRYRSSITDDHLAVILRIATSDIKPDFNAMPKTSYIFLPKQEKIPENIQSIDFFFMKLIKLNE